MSAASIRLGLAAATCAIAGGCTVITDVDVCEQRGPAEHDVNTRSEGNQGFPHYPTIAPIGGGDAFIAFDSALPPALSEVRFMRVDSRGNAIRACDVNGEQSIASAAVGYDQSDIAFPRNPGERDSGVIVYRETGIGGRHRLFATEITEAGCAIAGEFPDPFLVVDPAEGVQIHSPHVVSVGESRMVISWVELDPASRRSEVLGRVLQVDATGRFVPTVGGPGTEPDTLPPDGDPSGQHRLIFMGTNRFGMIWTEHGTGVTRVRFAVFDDRFQVVAGPIRLDERTGLADAGLSLAGAFDGEQFLLAWVLGTSETAGRAEASFVDAEARFLSSERSPDGAPFLLGPREVVGTETHLSITRLDGGGFLAAWALLDASATAGVDTYAIAFERDGSVAFSTRACDRTHFPMNQDRAGDQQFPVVSTLDDGTTLFIYTNGMGETSDRSGFGIRGTGLEASDLVVR